MWALFAAVALLWPSRIAGTFDGIPLETPAKAILLGLVLPCLLWFHASFLRTRVARAAIVVLAAWKIVMAVALVPDGWCVRFEPTRPLVSDAKSTVPHSWDVRADWLSDEPACSAVMRRDYHGLGEFPAWFFNLPPPSESWPAAEDRPPAARTAMTVTGFLHARRAGTFDLELTQDMAPAVYVDGELVRGPIELAPGTHRIRVDAMLTGDYWRFIPRWDGADLWSSAIATMKRPASLDVILRPIGGWAVTFLAAVLLVGWLVSFLGRVRSLPVILWTVAASAIIGTLAASRYADLARWGVVALSGASLVRVRAGLKNLFGAFVLIGIPWLTLSAVVHRAFIGRFIWYPAGHDYWMYQRFGYRIVMQGYWLEGGSKTFYFQPFYRWVSGLLHLVFGDSSVGEMFWDAACLLATALLAFHLTKKAAGFRCGLAAAATTLAVVAIGAPWALVGRGLSEITSAGFLYLSVFFLLRSRRNQVAYAIAAGVLATLAFYTRLNNLPMAVGIAAFALPSPVPSRLAWRPPIRLARVPWRSVVAFATVLGLGVLAFAWRTWYYSGVFSVFHGTQRHFAPVMVWQPGASFLAGCRRAADSIAMVLTLHDPPIFDWKALPVLVGAAIAPLALFGMPRLRDLPAAPILFFLIGLSAAVVSRGSAYEGRFSVHIIAITCALTTIAASKLINRAK